jgi:hypothetical protein
MGTRTGRPRGRPKGAKNKHTAEREAATKEMAAQIGKAVGGAFEGDALASVPTIGPGSFATMSATIIGWPACAGRVGLIGWSKTLCYVTGGAPWASTEYNGHMTRIIGADAAAAEPER